MHTGDVANGVCYPVAAGNFAYMRTFRDRFRRFRRRLRTFSIPPVLLNKYVFVFTVFAVWMLFFDRNNVITQIRRYHALREADNKTSYYIGATEDARRQLHALVSSPASLEKFAREKYYMKRPDEDVYVIVDK